MINKRGQDLISVSEKIMLKAYFCPAGKPTIGRGHTEGITSQMVRAGYTITAAQEQAQFEADMNKWEADVRACLKREPNENQLAAFVAFAFNIGLAAFKSSSVLKRYEEGDDVAVSRAMPLWNKTTDPVTKIKSVSNGLVTRRAAEVALYLTPVGNPVSETVPQIVDAPTSQAKSTINQAQVIAGGTAVITGVTQVVSQIGGLKSSVEGLGTWLLPVLCIVIIATAIYTVYARHQHHLKGDV